MGKKRFHIVTQHILTMVQFNNKLIFELLLVNRWSLYFFCLNRSVGYLCMPYHVILIEPMDVDLLHPGYCVLMYSCACGYVCECAMQLYDASIDECLNFSHILFALSLGLFTGVQKEEARGTGS